METTLGVLETKGFSSALAAAEIILEDKNIKLIKLEKIGGGIISLFFKGETAKLKSAMEKGVRQARLVGEIVSLYVLNNSSDGIERILFENKLQLEKSSTVKIDQMEKIIPSKEVKVEIVEKAAAHEQDKRVKEKPERSEKIKSPRLSESSSTIQRLRQEALASVGSSKEKGVKSRSTERKSFHEINLSKLETLNVHELRKAARSTNGFPIQGRYISRANRKELLNYFKELS